MFRNKACGGRTIRIVAGITALVLLLTSGASTALVVNDNSQTLYKVIYGFWPWWINSDEYEPDWSALTHISYDGMDAYSDGSLTAIKIEPNYLNVRNAARDNNVKVTINIGPAGEKEEKLNTIDYILAYHRNDLASNILLKLQEYEADGVSIDFEGVREYNFYTYESNTLLMEQFLEVLHTTLKNANPNYHISFCVQPFTEEIYLNANLAQYTDTVFLMGYDYHWPDHINDPIAGPVSPYNYPDPAKLDVDNSIIKLKKYYPQNKIILGLPLYGYDWPTTSNEKGANKVADGTGIEMKDAVEIAQTDESESFWDDESSTPWYRYQDNGNTWHQVWYENETSLRIKFNYAKSSNIGGIGFWALGYEGNSEIWTNLWNLVRMKFMSGRSGGPDSFGYTFKDSNTLIGPVYDWIEISETGTSVQDILPYDWWWVEMGGVDLDIGFNFNFYGNNYNKLGISRSGILSFDEGFIAPLGNSQSYETYGADNVFFQTIGSSPNRKFVIEWYNKDLESDVPFEAILYEGSNNIKIQYKDIYYEPLYSNNIGIKNPIEDFGLFYPEDEGIPPGMAILFEYPKYCFTNLYLSKQAPASKDRGSTITYNLYYHNFGNTEAQNVVLEDTLPAEVEFVSASNGGSYNPSTRKLIWNIGKVNPFGHYYQTVTVRIRQSVAIGTVIQNDASITTSTVELLYNDNEAHAQTKVTGLNLPPDVIVEPNNGGTGIPSVYWFNPITFTYYSSCATSVGINIHINDGGPDITGTMVETSPDTWTYTKRFHPRHGQALITYTVSGCPQTTVSFNIYIDPAGYIYDSITGARIKGASVWLQRPDGSGGWENVPTLQTPAIMQPDVNPLITGAYGQYQWDVLEGSYRVHVEASGYYPADSIVVSVPPPVTDLHIGLTRLPTTNQPPVANAGGPYTGTEGQQITFNASTSYDPDAGDSIASYEWDFNSDDITDATGMEVTHTWNDDYTGQISLKVTDSHGASSTATATVTVSNVPPTVSGDDLIVQWGDTLTLSGSFTDPSDDSWTAEINWGDGSPVEPGTISSNTVTGTHVYSTPAVYTATLTVRDDDNGAGSANPHITVTTRATNLEYIGDLNAQYSDTVTLKAKLSDSGNNNPLLGKSISFTLGAQTATAITGTDGVASATIKLDQLAGSYNVKAEFAGDANCGSNSDTKPFSITKEDVDITYTGDTIVPKTATSINLRATLQETDTDYGDLSKLKVSFTIYKSIDLTYSSPITTVPAVSAISVTSSGNGIGIAKATINNLPVDDYMIIARIVPNDYYKPITSDPTPLTVYEPTGHFTTGGGWILDPTGSHGNFGFTVKYNKLGKVQGNSVYVYRQNGLDYIVKSNAWIGLAIKGSISSFQGKASLQIYDPATGLLQSGSSGNFQFTVEAVDNELSKTPDTYKITVLNKDGLVYHSATGQLQGGNIVIHEK